MLTAVPTVARSQPNSSRAGRSGCPASSGNPPRRATSRTRPRRRPTRSGSVSPAARPDRTIGTAAWRRPLAFTLPLDECRCEDHREPVAVASYATTGEAEVAQAKLQRSASRPRWSTRSKVVSSWPRASPVLSSRCRRRMHRTPAHPLRGGLADEGIASRNRSSGRWQDATTGARRARRWLFGAPSTLHALVTGGRSAPRRPRPASCSGGPGSCAARRPTVVTIGWTSVLLVVVPRGQHRMGCSRRRSDRCG